MLTKNQYSRQGRPPYFSNFVVLTMGSTSHIALSKTSIEFFKNEARKYNTQYQKMIRRLLDEYAAHQS